MLFRGPERITIIITKESADQHNLEYTFPSRMVTLNVHSSLKAVGSNAVIARELKKLGVGSNPINGFFHNHCFVPEGREEEVLRALEGARERVRGCDIFFLA